MQTLVGVSLREYIEMHRNNTYPYAYLRMQTLVGVSLREYDGRGWCEGGRIECGAFLNPLAVQPDRQSGLGEHVRQRVGSVRVVPAVADE